MEFINTKDCIHRQKYQSSVSSTANPQQNCHQPIYDCKNLKGLNITAHQLSVFKHKPDSLKTQLLIKTGQLQQFQNTQSTILSNAYRSVKKINEKQQSLKLNKNLKNLHEARKAKKPQLEVLSKQGQNLKNTMNIKFTFHTPIVSNQKQCYSHKSCQGSKMKGYNSQRCNKNNEYSSVEKSEQSNKQNEIISEFRTDNECWYIKQNIIKNRYLNFDEVKLSESIMEIQQKQIIIEQSVILNFNILDNFQIIKIHEENQQSHKLLAIQNSIYFLMLIKKFNNPDLQQINNQIIMYNKIISHPNILNHYRLIIDPNQQVLILLEYYDYSLKHSNQLFSYKNIIICLKHLLQATQYLCSLKIYQQLIKQNVVMVNGIYKLANFEKAKYQKKMNNQDLRKLYYQKLHQFILELLNLKQTQANIENEGNKDFEIFLAKLKDDNLEFQQIKTELFVLEFTL